MGKENDILCSYLEDNERFADLFNGSFFGGEQVVRPEDLQEASEVYSGSLKDQKGSYQRIRDIKKILKNGMTLNILAIESQTRVDYSMPWRCLNYDDLEYGGQISRIKKRNQEHGDYGNAAERLCRMKKSDRLVPVYTLCLYHGKEPWDGPRCLKDMMDFGEEKAAWERCFSDYSMNLLCVNEQDDFTCFHTPLKGLFSLLRYRQDKRGLKKLFKEDMEYQEMDEETAQVVSSLMGVDKFMNESAKYRKGDRYNMCEALQEMMEDSRLEGKAEGKAEAILELLEELGEVSENTRDKIYAQQNPEILRYWLKLAAKAESVDMFVEKMF